MIDRADGTATVCQLVKLYCASDDFGQQGLERTRRDCLVALK